MLEGPVYFCHASPMVPYCTLEYNIKTRKWILVHYTMLIQSSSASHTFVFVFVCVSDSMQFFSYVDLCDQKHNHDVELFHITMRLSCAIPNIATPTPRNTN